MSLLTPAAYARSKGLSRSAISQAIESGRIPTVADAKGRKRIDPRAADAALAALTDHAQAESGNGNKGKRNGNGASESGRSSWISTKTTTERIKAEMLALDLAERKGELLNKAIIEQEIATLLSNLRDEMLGVGARTGAQARAAKTDAEACRLIDNAIRDAMRHVAAKIPEVTS
jgi:malate synthase